MIPDSSKSVSKTALWERKLLDFSLRNNLLNAKLGKRCLPFVSFGLSVAEDNIQKGKDFSILAFEDKKIEPSEDGMYNSQMQASAYKEKVEEYVTKNKLLSFLSESELAASLKYLFRTSRTATEENGVNSLFLTLGMLKWYEDEKSEQPRFAPLLLIPVNLIRKGGNNGYVLRLREEEVIFNITLAEFLRQQFKLHVDFQTSLPVDESGVDIKAVFEGMKTAVVNMKRWEIAEEMTLGMFYFNKFVMWSDIHNNKAAFENNLLIKSLIENKILWEDATDANDEQTDMDNVSLSDIALPMDADSSQMKAVIQAAQGRSFILHGPPGTGKSQTITNIIANALFHGKRVLFVAEKMAALSVVQKRLEKIGIGDFCLEMHSNKSTKSHFLSQMQKALDVVHIKEPQAYKQLAEELHRQRQAMIDYKKALHSKPKTSDDDDSSTDYSLYECINGYLSIEQDEIKGSIPSSIDRKEITDLLKEIDNMAVAFNVCPHPAVHVLKGLYPKDNSQRTLDVLRSLLEETTGQTNDKQLLTLSFDLLKSVDTNVFGDNELIKLRSDINKLQDEKLKAEKKFFLIKPFAKHAYKKLLNRTAEDNHAALESLKSKSVVWLEHFDDIKAWYQWVQIRNKFAESSVSGSEDMSSVYNSKYKEFFAYVESNEVSPEYAFKAWLKSVYKAKITQKIDSDPMLRSFNGLMFDEIIAKYRKNNAEFQQLTREELYYKLASAVPSQTIQAMASSEMGILKRNIMNGGRGVSVRNIIDSVPNLIEKLAPCMLMSPISVAQYLDINKQSFDLVIFDEASQMPTSEAIGAIARSKSLVVVGDPKQMPPTNFFSVSQTDDDEAQIDDLESILDDCIALSVPSYYLQWHYRSKHESLIAFSNTQYYDNRLYTFPSTDDKQAKVRLVQIEGTYDKGKTRSNVTEAQAIVDEVVKRLSDNDLSKYSIGIVSFSKAQQDLIEDLLTDALAKNPKLEEKAYGGEEPIFVKNLENVQGDERDVILFSVGYGPDKDGKISMNFGPLNNIGGERRLNVAVSRSRYEMIVYSTIRSEDIDLKRSSAKGVEGLKRFLDFAKTNNQSVLTSVYSDNTVNTSVTSSYTLNKQTKDDNAIIDSLAKELEKDGYKTVKNVGRSDFYINLAICDKQDVNRYVTAVLHDDHYTGTVTDREIVQAGALERLKWKVIKLWSIDWYSDKTTSIERIKQQLHSMENTSAVAKEQSLSEEPQYVFSTQNLKEDKSLINQQNKAFKKYQNTDNERKDISQIPQTVIEEAVIFALQQQIALPENDLKRTTAKILGFARVGNKIDAVIQEVIFLMQNKGKIRKDKDNIVLT